MITIDERNLFDLKVSPDQEEGNINVDFKEHYKNVFVDFTTVKGQLLFSKNYSDTNKINFKVSNFLPGFYTVKINNQVENRLMNVIITD